ncbi:hypothetical protein DNL40_05530 [Xylanimonas oleitrophica]|uniref:DUF2142 domain-containing protein n=1 Tax=Xylanimonas oleitrophica TaxID=2607479 RepID=A0A2W5XVA6_9MICO|nr:DUF2142 domain-containing protein [Xylanimonas oleitrophica]PZR54358.1 hypothetical protein DNL40_05530 [Xylanimonas oleitrophica]
MRPPGHRLLDVLLPVLVAGVAATWALLTPPLQAPDEPQHLNSVVRLAYGGGWPAPGAAALGPAVADAREEVALGDDVPGRYADRPDVPQLVDATPVPAAERTRVDAATALPDGSRPTPDDVDQMTQHPPLYYLLGAAVLHATGLAEGRWDLQLLALRLLDVALLVPVVPLASWSVRRLTGSTAAGMVAGTFTLFLPQVGHILGSATNDALVTLVGAVVTALCVRVLTGDRSWRTAAVIGAVVGVGLLTKVMSAFLLPVVAMAYVVTPGGAAGPAASLDAPGRWRALLGDARRVLLMGGVALVVGGWWWVRNLVVLGTVQPVGLERDLPPLRPRGALVYVELAWQRLVRSFFGDLGWLDLRTPPAFWVTGIVVLLALGAVALVVPGTRRAAAVLLALPSLLTVAVLANGWDYYAQTGYLVGHQGRYLFSALVALAVVLALAVRGMVGGAESRVRAALPVVVAAGTSVAVYGLVFGFTGFYRGPGESVADAVSRWEAFSPVGPVWLVAVPALTALTALVVLGLAVHAALRPPRAAA